MAEEEAKTEEVQETQEKEEVVDKDTGSGISTLEDALKELEKVRKEAAKRRVQNKDQEEKAKQWEEHVRSQKTELERLTEDKAALAEEARQLRLENLRQLAILKTGLDPELEEFLTGETEEELMARAKKLVEKAGKKEGSKDFFAGQRGKPVGQVADSTDAFFAQLWRDASTATKFK